MSLKTKLKLRTEVLVAGYCFPSKPGLVWHSGKWWLWEEETKTIYNNGSLSVLYEGSKISVRKLRKEAVKCTVKLIDQMPF